MDITVYERDKGFVLSRLREGEFDYIDTGDEVFEADFFGYISARGILKALAGTFPSPRKKAEVPVWLVLGSALSMRLHGVAAFQQYNYVIRSGGFINAFGAELGSKKTDLKRDTITLACNGFNHKNHYPRQTPCDADTLRKFYRDTDAPRMQQWYNTDVAKLWKKRHAFDAQGLFIGDATYLFVPDNPRYEGSVCLLFDEGGHPVDPKAVNQDKVRAGQYQWRRCYKLVTLLHLYPEADCFLFVGFRLLGGNASELPPFYELVDEFVEAVGAGVIKRLILDRGFVDGARIGHLKKDYGIDVLIPLKHNMDIWVDAMGLKQEVTWQTYEPPPRPARPAPPPRPKPEAIRRREAARHKTLAEQRAQRPEPPAHKVCIKREVAAQGGFESWSSCPVPLSVIYCRDTYADGHVQEWLLLDTAHVDEPSHHRTLYRLRDHTEERYRQLKCFTDLAHFTSRHLSLVTQQVLTVVLTYSLLQLYLVRKGPAELNHKPLPYMRRQLLPSASWVIVYCQGRVAFFDGLTYTEIMLTLSEEARNKALARTRRLKRKAVLLHEGRDPP